MSSNQTSLKPRPPLKDVEFMRGQSEWEDLRQHATREQTQGKRLHQRPAAFVLGGSGLEGHGAGSARPLPWTHLDTAGRQGRLGDLPKAAPVAALAARYDFAAHAAQSESEDVVQAGTKASSQTLRGHQDPAAFLNIASGLVHHGRDSAHPLRYTHLDMAGREGDFPGLPWGAPVGALTAAYVFPRL